jgi:hypothetical protein
MSDRGFENKQKGKYACKSSPLLAILPDGPQKKFQKNKIKIMWLIFFDFMLF